MSEEVDTKRFGKAVEKFVKLNAIKSDHGDMIFQFIWKDEKIYETIVTKDELDKL